MIDNKTKKILETFIMATSQKDNDVLLEKMLESATEITNCDGGTLYIINEDKLDFRVMITKSKGIINSMAKNSTMPQSIEMLRENVCAYCALENKTVNIKDVYESKLFDFSGPQNFDKSTHYRTKSMIVLPMQNDKGDVIGVLQLINAMDESGEIISFSENNEMILKAFASQTAIKLTNMNYTMQIKDLMESIVKTFAQVIYLRTQYNVSHTHNMKRYAEKFLSWLLENPQDEISFDPSMHHLLYMSIWLHDVGKLVTPLEIMDKATRLSVKIERVMTRLDIISLTIKLNGLKNNEDVREKIEELETIRQFVKEVNTKAFLDKEILEEVAELGRKTYKDENGDTRHWFTQDEIEDLSIVRGTLTGKERLVMQEHVDMTRDILDKMDFREEYENVPKWASAHHELLDGSGYPRGISGDELDNETRLLTIIDIFDGLSAKDRPYKKPTPLDKVFEIMEDMAEHGKLDKTILSLFKVSKAWE